MRDQRYRGISLPIHRTKRLTTSTKPFDIDWIKEAVRTPKQADDIPDDAFRCIYIGATKNRPFKGLTDLIDAFILLDDPRVHLTIVGEYGEMISN